MTRPTFASAWAAAQRIYDPTNSGARVAAIIGGQVAYNINHPDPTLRWGNTCAVRVSYALNRCGTHIPRIRGKTVSGADKNWYFYRIDDVIHFLSQIWGKPEAVVSLPPPGGGPIAGKKGLLVFQISGFADAKGHATLWDGKNCYDKCYFNAPGVAYRAERGNFWSLR